MVTAKVERLVNLTIALLETRRPLTLRELKQRTGYYDQQDKAAARRMFERDKDELRRLGVPIEVQTIAFGDEQGYLVPRRAYELADLDLTGEEVAALGLAVRLTGTPGTPLALAKLAARAPDPVDLATPTVRVDLPVDASEAIADAVVRRRRLQFGYRRADGTESPRTIDPYAVIRRRAAWYVVGHDQDRSAMRAFRLDRMTDEPRAVGEDDAFVPPADLDLEAAVSGPPSDERAVTIAVGAQARWAVELRGGTPTGQEYRGRPVYTIAGLHPWRDRSWLLGLGAEVVVLDPPELRDTVRASLDAVIAGAGA